MLSCVRLCVRRTARCMVLRMMTGWCRWRLRIRCWSMFGCLSIVRLRFLSQIPSDGGNRRLFAKKSLKGRWLGPTMSEVAQEAKGDAEDCLPRVFARVWGWGIAPPWGGVFWLPCAYYSSRFHVRAWRFSWSDDSGASASDGWAGKDKWL